MKVTVKMIAKELGISPSAVSFALNGKPGVSEATRQAVLEKASEMGFFTRYAAAGKKSPKYIRFIIYRGGRDVLTQIPFYPRVLQGVEIRAREMGYDVLVSYCDRADFSREQFEDLCSGVEGILVMGTELQKEDEICRVLTEQCPVPVVVLDNDLLKDQVDCIVTDNAYGAGQAIDYLAQKGHRSIVYLVSRQRIANFNERREGVLQAVRRHPQLDLKMVEVSFVTKESAAQIRDWLETTEQLPTAMFADSDMIAIGALQALLEKGVRVPEDISVIGFDDMEACMLAPVQLTSVRVMKQQMGISAFMMLYERMKSPYPALMENACFYLTIGTCVKERDSVSVPPASFIPSPDR